MVETKFMKKAILMSKTAFLDVPVGAVIVKDGKVIAFTANEKEKTKDPTAHAEIVAIRQACEKLGNWRLDGCQMYVTLEPCPMCAWAILQSRIDTVYFGAYDNQYGALGSKMDLRECANSKLQVFGGILEDECNNIIEEFFKNCRK